MTAKSTYLGFKRPLRWELDTSDPIPSWLEGEFEAHLWVPTAELRDVTTEKQVLFRSQGFVMHREMAQGWMRKGKAAVRC